MERVADTTDIEVVLDDLRRAFLREPPPSTAERTLARLRAEAERQQPGLIVA